MKITRIETTPCPTRPQLLLCRVHTDEGLHGCGESFYIPEAAAAVIHDWMAQRLLGADPAAIEGHWRFLYERATNFGARGAEFRALSALDLALWDIKGKACGLPVWQLIGGNAQEGVRVYHSVGYGENAKPHPAGSWPGYGRMGEPNPYNDYWNVIHEPAAFAKSMVEAGIGAIKLWTFDDAAHKPNGSIYMSYADIREAMKPFHAVREAVGDQLELILDGHGFFQLPVAMRIADAMRAVNPLCLEDVIRPDCIDTIRDFRDRCGLPLAVSEMLTGPEHFLLLLEKRATDYVMMDPTWIGGISQTIKVTDLAQYYNLPVIMHDCTGPLTLLAGVHVGLARANVAWQETTRMDLYVRYPEMIDTHPEIRDGRIYLSDTPGIGTDWNPDFFRDPSKIRVSQL